MTRNAEIGPMSLPDGWRWVKLGEVCVQDKNTIKRDDRARLSLPYVSLEHLESETGRIDMGSVLSNPREVLSNTYEFSSMHVLYGRLRPYLNKVATPDFRGRCTTEIIPLLPQGIIRDFLAYALRRPETVHHAMQSKTGTRMPRTDMHVLMDLPIPLPPIEEQKRIVGVLNERLGVIEEVKQALETQLEVTDALPKAYLRQVFAGEL